MAKKIDWASESKGDMGTLQRVDHSEDGCGWFVTDDNGLGFFVESTHCEVAPTVGELDSSSGSV